MLQTPTNPREPAATARAGWLWALAYVIGGLVLFAVVKYIGVAPLLVCGGIAVLLIGAGACAQYAGWLRFWRRYRRRVIVVWGSRRRWHEFCVNNLLPALPPEVEAVQQQLGGPRYWLGLCGPRPCLFLFRGRRVQLVPLQKDLLPLKQRTCRRDSVVQAEVRVIVERAVAMAGTKKR